jgi:hypothetical protein
MYTSPHTDVAAAADCVEPLKCMRRVVAAAGWLRFAYLGDGELREVEVSVS